MHLYGNDCADSKSATILVVTSMVLSQFAIKIWILLFSQRQCGKTAVVVTLKLGRLTVLHVYYTMPKLWKKWPVRTRLIAGQSWKNRVITTFKIFSKFTVIWLCYT